MSDRPYPGRELDTFAAARNWKAYWYRQVAPFVAGEVAEIGAGIGSNTRLFEHHRVDAWVAVEPDAAATRRLAACIQTLAPGAPREALVGSLDAVGARVFDTIMYIDVLEHIGDDRAELGAAADRLRAGGHLIVLSPAYAWLSSPFDDAIGHLRRYTRATLQAIAPASLRPVRLRYLDAAGLLPSALNRVCLKRSMPAPWQVKIWDRGLIPVSRLLDRAFGYTIGKSVLAVWRRD
jgi:SAM-dependent methyltransferase